MPAARAAKMACWWLTPRSNGFTGSVFACVQPSTSHAMMLLGTFVHRDLLLNEFLTSQALLFSCHSVHTCPQGLGPIQSNCILPG